MLRTLGLVGITGLLIALAGVGIIAYVNPVLAGGVVLTLVGIALAVQALVKGVLSKFGFL